MKSFWSMNEQMKERAGVVVGTFLLVDSLVNLYWATGSIWPASDPKTLSLAVLNANYSFAPQITIPLACLSLCGALVTLARVHRLGKLGRLIPASLLQVGILVVTSALLVRGVVGIGWVLGLGANPKTPFYWLNLLIYTPACLVIFAAAVAAARSERSKGKLADLAQQNTK